MPFTIVVFIDSSSRTAILSQGQRQLDNFAKTKVKNYKKYFVLISVRIEICWTNEICDSHIHNYTITKTVGVIYIIIENNNCNTILTLNF